MNRPPSLKGKVYECFSLYGRFVNRPYGRMKRPDKPKFEIFPSYQNIFQNPLDISPIPYYNIFVVRKAPKNALTGNLPAMCVQRAAVWCEAVGQATSLTPERRI